MIQEYIWRSKQVKAIDNLMSTLIVSFYFMKINKELNVDKAERNQIYTMHINKESLVGTCYYSFMNHYMDNDLLFINKTITRILSRARSRRNGM
jgi:hypothetical protein